MKMHPFIALATVGLSFCFASCASLSNSLSDSKPLDYAHKATNEEEVLNFCSELTQKDNAVDLTAQCLEIALRRFPNLRTDQELVTLFRSLNQKRGAAQGSSSQNLGIWAAFGLVRGDKHMANACQDEPFNAAATMFPDLKNTFNARCGKVLAEHNNKSTVLPDELQGLSEDLRAAYGPSSVPLGGSIKLSPQILNYCKDYRPYVAKIMAVKDLIEYRNVVQNNDQGSSGPLLNKIEMRVTTLLSEIVDVKPTLERTYSELGRAFNRADCYFTVSTTSGSKKVRTRRPVTPSR